LNFYFFLCALCALRGEYSFLWLFGIFLGGLFFGGEEGRRFHGREAVAELFQLALGRIETPFRLLQMLSQLSEFFLKSYQLAAKTSQVRDNFPGPLFHFQSPQA
jgi:hypothetical protein